MAEKNLSSDHADDTAIRAEEKDMVTIGVDEDAAIDGVSPVYAAKARVLNRAIQEIGMGRYQWQLFFVIGFGWAQE